MSESNATATYQRPPYIYGEILSLYQPPPPKLPGIGRFLSQGTADNDQLLRTVGRLFTRSLESYIFRTGISQGRITLLPDRLGVMQ